MVSFVFLATSKAKNRLITRLYRAEIVKALSLDPLQELEWLNKVSLRHLKNYQIWGHRPVIMSLVPELPPSELPFLARILAKDAKNYHVWSYRQWLVRHFSLWPRADDRGSELPFVESLLISDVRNNSAWNHRYFILFGRDDESTISPEAFQGELEYTKGKIALAPQNAAAWNYLRGIVQKRGTGSKELEDFAIQYADIDNVEEIRSSHALDFLADIWEKENSTDKAKKALDLLTDKFDPIRKNYWQYRKGLLDTVTAA